MEEGLSLTVTPTWAVATVITLMVSTALLFTRSIEFFAHWLDKTKRKRKPMLAALHKIKEEFIVFGVLSLLLGHWSIYVAKICMKASLFSTRFYPCIPETKLVVVQHDFIIFNNSKDSQFNDKDLAGDYVSNKYCDEGYESFASYESLEQLHRLLFVLGVTHVTYSSLAIALAIIKIYSWRTWEDEAKAMALQPPQDHTPKLNRLCTFVVHHASHPWSQHKVLVWLTHGLPISYDFLNYMIRSTDEEFRDIVGISVPLWIYAIFCIFLDFHGTNVYFWLSFLPAIIIIVIGTKLHRIVVKIAVEVMESQSYVETQEFKLRDELFWFRKPRLLLRFIQFISFQNAFEMAMVLWSLWEINGTSCFMDKPSFIAIRLAFGIISQVWCSFITFPLYVIITQMGSRFKKTVISEGVRRSLHGWKRRVKARQNSNNNANNGRQLTSVSSMPLIHTLARFGSRSYNRSNSGTSTSSGGRNEGSRRRMSQTIDYGNAGVLFTPQRSRSSYVDKDFSMGEGYDSDTTSSDYYNYHEEQEDDYKNNDGHYYLHFS